MPVQLLPESYCEQEKYDFRHVNLETRIITVHSVCSAKWDY
jgi:hypothetical protein